MPQSGGVLRKRVAGALLMALGAFALATPVAAGRWSLAILRIPLIVLSVRQRLPAVSACAVCRQPAAVELRPGRQRPVDSARRNSPDRRFRQDPGRLA